jgi:acyl-CoA synthetase (AMP-forming)/AMP-acid ligase II
MPLTIPADVQACTRPIPGGPQSPAEALRLAAEENGATEAVVGRSGRITWADLDVAASGVAELFRQLGVRPGDRVACSLPNDLDIAVAFFGVLRAEAIWVGVNQQLAQPEQAFLLEDSGASLFVTQSIGLGSAGQLDNCRAVAVDEPSHGWREAWTTATTGAVDDPDPFAAAAIAYTSGTTGRPKGAVHAHRNLVLPLVSRNHLLEGATPRRLGQCLPLTILNIMVLGPLNAAVNQTTFVAMDRVDADGVAEWLQQEAIESVILAPPTVRDLLVRDDIDSSVGKSLTLGICGGAAFPDWYRDAWASKFDCPLEGGYGMTEAPTSVVFEDGRPPLGACGKSAPHVRVTIRDESGELCPTGTEGEVCVEPNRTGHFAQVWTPMIGYWQRSDATAEALIGSRYRTGDIGRMDAEGWLSIADRRNDLILRGGANVYPAEIERVLVQHLDVVACAVLGQHDERLGERVVAVYQSLSGADIGDELRQLCSGHLARYKVPANFVRIDEFPRNAMGKIVKPALSTIIDEQARAVFREPTSPKIQ